MVFSNCAWIKIRDFRYQELQDAITKGISNGLEAILILVAVGALIGTWIAGGVVPTLIYYGLRIYASP